MKLLGKLGKFSRQLGREARLLLLSLVRGALNMHTVGYINYCLNRLLSVLKAFYRHIFIQNSH